MEEKSSSEKRLLVNKNELERAIENTFAEFTVVRNKQTALSKAGNIIFITTMSSFVVPYYLIAGVEVNSSNKVINILSPICIISMNLVQAAYAADAVWDFFKADKNSGQVKWKIRTKQCAAIFASIWQTLPYTIGAYFIAIQTYSERF